MLILGILKESQSNLVCMLPEMQEKIKQETSIHTWFEADCGLGAGKTNEDYIQYGGQVKSREKILSQADILLSYYPLSIDEVKKLKKDSVYISQFKPFADSKAKDFLQYTQAEVFSMDMVPRISAAQSVDILSAMSSLSGYKAVIRAADLFARYFPMMITAAGTIPPAQVLVIGAGVAGLQAIATAKRLGAKVEAIDTRASAAEEARSLGATFLQISGSQDNKNAGGYAVEQSQEYKERQRQFMVEACRRADIIICTALLRNGPAPKIISTQAVDGMKRGSIIIDLASVSGGNCELTQHLKLRDYKGIKILGTDQFPELSAQDASKMLSNIFFNFIRLMIKENKLNIDMNNEILKSTYLPNA